MINFRFLILRVKPLNHDINISLSIKEDSSSFDMHKRVIYLEDDNFIFSILRVKPLDNDLTGTFPYQEKEAIIV